MEIECIAVCLENVRFFDVLCGSVYIRFQLKEKLL